jgi:hypothetical protein
MSKQNFKLHFLKQDENQQSAITSKLSDIYDKLKEFQIDY